MKKHILGLLAAALLVSGFNAVPVVSAASSAVGTNHNDSSSGNSNEGTNSGTTVGGTDNGSNSASIEKVIADGMKYVGTPYEFGSNRNNTTTFDCSDYVRWIFKETLGISLPADSRQQGAYVKDNGTAETDWHNLKRGDLMFFMSYKGSNAANYKRFDKSTERITHVAIYLGNGKILHTYSNESGGVHVGEFAGTAWEQRFLFGGSVLSK
ncbi:C40 family peptidase [Cohnella silvisoli]|uniref:C40 family peptidase n=1 Tax=Cohnella silvisoli TaxID=2873699 RepID=UPI002814C174|nr:C40 family peptidase [Cohnella silvisoli]MCD9023870.1 C40 family peptidase [Cohnella silvisoli]